MSVQSWFVGRGSWVVGRGGEVIENVYAIPPDPSPPREFKRSRKGIQKESILEWKMNGDE